MTCSPAPSIGSTWERLIETVPERQACKLMVGLLDLAARGACEVQLAQILGGLLQAGTSPDLEGLEARFAPHRHPCRRSPSPCPRCRLRRAVRGGGMSAIEMATLPMMLTELRLPTIKRLWPALAEQSNREGWPAERFLAALCEHEMHERETRRIDRHRAESALPPNSKRLSAFEFAAVPTVSKAHVTALAEGDSWLEQGANILLFGPPGVGKTHPIAGVGHALIERGREPVRSSPARATWCSACRPPGAICACRPN